MSRLAQAIRNLRPGAEWMLEGDTFDGLEWLDPKHSPPGRREVDQEVARLKQLAEATRYRRERRRAYIEAGVTLEALVVAIWEAHVEGRNEGIRRLEALRQKIKERYPAPHAGDPHGVPQKTELRAAGGDGAESPRSDDAG